MGLPGRLTNASLFLLLGLAFATGWLAFELSGQSAKAVLWLHAAAGLAVALLPSARRAPTGSFEAAYPVATQWMFDGVPQLDARSWRLAAAGKTWAYDDLAGFSDRVSAVIDCTGGWYSEQVWEGVMLERLLPADARSHSSVNVISHTGY